MTEEPSAEAMEIADEALTAVCHCEECVVRLAKYIEAYKDAAVRRAVEEERERVLRKVQEFIEAFNGSYDASSGDFWTFQDMRNAVGKEAAHG